MRQKTIQILEKNTGSNLFDIGYSSFLLDMSPVARETRAKINYLGLHHNKNCTAKETINKTQRQPTEWEKIFANDILVKDYCPKYISISNIYNSTSRK